MLQKMILIMVQKLNKFTCFVFMFLSAFCFAQNDGVQSPVYNDYKNDTTYKDFDKLRYKVAYAQINLLKKGALLVRLKTNIRAISKLKSAGNIDLATNLEKETELENRIIMSAYKKEFTFCPVYFFYSESSDSIRKNNLTGIFVDSTLKVNSSIVCNASFFLVAEQDGIYNSSLGIVPESLAKTSREKGSYSRDAAIVVKNKYFIQLHKPFPFFQIKGGATLNSKLNQDGLYTDIADVLIMYRKVSRNSDDYKRMKSYRSVVSAFNSKLGSFYSEHQGAEVTPEIKEFVY
jgi:hypothetical protein